LIITYGDKIYGAQDRLIFHVGKNISYVSYVQFKISRWKDLLVNLHPAK